tara:strand:- start:270 stop:800 length:531 start_codon:yes stop_codon:yes gene_type:complete
MKKLTVILGIVLTILNNLNAQVISQSEVDVMTKKPRGVRFTKYIDNNNNEYKIGDTLTIGNGSNNNHFSYLKATYLLEEQFVSPSVVGTKIIIKKIKVYGSKRRGFKVHITTKLQGVFTYVFFIKDCIESGEIIGKGYTSDKALLELKKAKDKLDLELITREEFNKIKDKLSKYIK